MIQFIRDLILTLVLVSLPALAVAATPAWQIVPTESSITFTATQNNAPVTGQFKSFSGEINFDPAELSTSHVKISVDLGSITTSYKEVGDTLKTPDWFDIKLFPQGVFQANKFTKMGNNQYTADGTLTIRDKTLPLVLTFVLDEYSQNKAHATGETTIKRTAFGVGKGDWAKTDEIKDDVKVDFKLTTVKK